METNSPFSAGTMLRLAALRGVALGVLWLGYYWLTPYLWGDDHTGANIGAGLVAFGLLVLGSCVWAFVDGRRLPSTPAVVGWLLAPAFTAVIAGVHHWIAETARGEELPVSDPVFVSVFLIVMTVPPAMVALMLGRASEGMRRQRGSHA